MLSAAPRDQRGRNMKDIRLINQAIIFQAIHRAGTISRTELAKATGLNPATITHIIRELLERGVVQEVGFGESRGGRRRALLRIHAERGYIVAVSLERQSIRGMVTDLNQREVVRRSTASVSLSQPAQITLPALLSFIRSLIDDSALERSRFIGIGISAPGPLDAGQGVLISPPNFPGWPRTALRRIVEEETGIATFLDNDANASALAEKWFGAAREMSNYVYILADTGIGGGVVIDGDIYRGAHDIAGELGHTTIQYDGPPCDCGNAGCLELYASPQAVVRRVRQAVAAGKPSGVTEMVGGNPDGITFAAVAEAALQGDAVALEALDASASALAAGIVNVVNAFDPEAILIGGQLCLAGEAIMARLREGVARRRVRDQECSVAIMPGKLQSEAQLTGAFCLVLRQLFKLPEPDSCSQLLGPLPLHGH